MKVWKVVIFKDNSEKGKVTKRFQIVHILNRNVRTLGEAYYDHFEKSDYHKQMKTLTQFAFRFYRPDLAKGTC